MGHRIIVWEPGAAKDEPYPWVVKADTRTLFAAPTLQAAIKHAQDAKVCKDSFGRYFQFMTDLVKDKLTS